jgi:hypothetical protein
MAKQEAIHRKLNTRHHVFFLGVDDSVPSERHKLLAVEIILIFGIRYFGLRISGSTIWNVRNNWDCFLK